MRKMLSLCEQKVTAGITNKQENAPHKPKSRTSVRKETQNV